jgi:hypothetical protein
MTDKTRIVVQVDSQFTHRIFLRGEGPTGLNWQKGVELIHAKPDEWIFETETPFATGEFKVLVDDKTFELGDNHPLYPGATIRINPKFPN